MQTFLKIFLLFLDIKPKKRVKLTRLSKKNPTVNQKRYIAEAIAQIDNGKGIPEPSRASSPQLTLSFGK